MHSFIINRRVRMINQKKIWIEGEERKKERKKEENDRTNEKNLSFIFFSSLCFDLLFIHFTRSINEARFILLLSRTYTGKIKRRGANAKRT